jgi:hypothetical protein
MALPPEKTLGLQWLWRMLLIALGRDNGSSFGPEDGLSGFTLSLRIGGNCYCRPQKHSAVWLLASERWLRAWG